jgi:dTMP kinase
MSGKVFDFVIDESGSGPIKRGMIRPIPGGLLIAVEGIDGAGKTSVATVIAQWCGERGIACVMSKEPTGLTWGNELRKSAREGRLTLERELELFELDRRDHVKRSIQPALDEGNIVILDRYYWSTAAYQGGRGADYQEIMRSNEAFAPIPDLVLVLNVDVDAGLQRIRMRGDKPNLFESKSALTKAKQIFVQLSEQNKNARLIDASGHLKETAPLCLSAFQHAAIAKIAHSAPLHPEMVNRALEFFGECRIDAPYPENSPPVPSQLERVNQTA